jgi:putative ABC transport system ATP-binding protein
MDLTYAHRRMLELNAVRKTYATHSGDLTVLDDITFGVDKGQSIAVTGPSGSGKTTLLGLCAGLDTPSSGSIRLKDTELADLDEEARAFFRMQHLGFVFQNFQLLPTLTAIENVCIPLELKGHRNPRRKAMDWLAQVGLADRADHYPVQLSGGEQQRVAIARASVSEPAILFADEPTGNLDEGTSEHIEEVLFAAHRQNENTLVLVTHDNALAARTDRVLRLEKGRLVSAAHPLPAS